MFESLEKAEKFYDTCFKGEVMKVKANFLLTRIDGKIVYYQEFNSPSDECELCLTMNDKTKFNNMMESFRKYDDFIFDRKHQKIFVCSNIKIEDMIGEYTDADDNELMTMEIQQFDVELI